LHSFKTWDPADPGLEPGRVDEKTGQGLARQNPVDSGKPTETRLFLYIYKMTSFLALAFYYQLTKSFALQREDRITIHRIRNPNLFNLQSS
jgi:hypothetical protein